MYTVQKVECITNTETNEEDATTFQVALYNNLSKVVPLEKLQALSKYKASKMMHFGKIHLATLKFTLWDIQ